jgi:uncharacterized protein YqgC (DUF456 family)
MIENIFLLIAIVLMLAGIAGSLIPAMPGPLLSMLGAGIYWYGTGFSEPGTLALVMIFGTGILALLFDSLSGYLGSKAGGASSRTAIAAGLAGFLLFFVAGPVGIILGVTGVVFIREYLRTGEPRDSLRASIFTMVSVMASSAVQAILTFLMLLVFAVSLVI